MKYRQLGPSGLKVSEIGLGGNNFGAGLDAETSMALINQAIEIGINFIDTADMYARGRSEEIIGQALAGKRSRVILATKFGHPAGIGPDEQGGSRHFIMKAVEASLQRLKTDYIDLYYLHYPDTLTPIEETLRTLDDLVRSGRVRYIGCSNLAAWQLAEALGASRLNNLESFIVVQSRYNLLYRDIESELIPCCQHFGVGVVPWGPLASGFLTGKYQRGQAVPAGARLANPPRIYRDVLTEANFDKLARIEMFARQRGLSVSEVAIAWLLSHPWLGSVIAGAMNTEQLSANLAAASCQLTAEDIVELDKVSA